MLSIDITDTHVSMVQAATSGIKIRILKARKYDLPPGVVENGRIKDLHMLAGIITEAMVNEQFKKQPVTLCINSGIVLYKELLLPKPRNITQLLMENLISNDMGLSDAYNINYSIVAEVQEADATMIKVIASACPQEIVDGYILLAKQMGLKLKEVVISSDCVSRIMSLAPPKEEQSPLLLLQVDKRFINMNIYVDNSLVSSRYVMFDPADYEGNKDAINLCIFDNVFRIIHFFNSGVDTEPIKHICYYGTYEDENALAATLSQFGLPYSEFERPPEIIGTPGFKFIEYTNVIASMYKVNKKDVDANLLLSKEVREKLSNLYFLRLLVGAAAALILITGGMTLFTGEVKRMKENELSNIQAEYAQYDYENIMARVRAKQQAIQSFEVYVEQVERAKAIADFQYNMTPGILQKLKDEMLSGMTFKEEVKVTNDSVTATFLCENDTDPTKYTENLIEQGYFENVSYTGYKLTDEGKYEFTLTMQLKGGNGFEA